MWAHHFRRETKNGVLYCNAHHKQQWKDTFKDVIKRDPRLNKHRFCGCNFWIFYNSQDFCENHRLYFRIFVIPAMDSRIHRGLLTEQLLEGFENVIICLLFKLYYGEKETLWQQLSYVCVSICFMLLQNWQNPSLEIESNSFLQNIYSFEFLHSGTIKVC